MGRFLAETSLTKRAAVANISSPIMAWSGCTQKNKTNKQANNAQSRSLSLGLPKQMVGPAYICKGPRCSSC